MNSRLFQPKFYLGYLVLIYLRFWARLQLKKVDPLIVGITGSVGKTSTRRAASIILHALGRVKETHHANSESGIPLNLLDLSPRNYSLLDWLRLIFSAPLAYLTNHHHYDYYLVEMGIDAPHPPKNMAYLLTILKPHVGIVLNAHLAHTAAFDPLVKDKHRLRRRQKLIHLIAQEKGKLVTTMDSSGLAILNRDQPEIFALACQTHARVLTFGHHPEADIRILKTKRTKTAFHLTLTYRAQQAELSFSRFPLEDNYAYTFAAAITLGVGLGMPFQQAATLLQDHYTPPPGRWSVFPGIKHTTLVDSSYNASPRSMESALINFRKLARRAHKVAVIGDMRELGREAKQAHKDLANWLIDNVDQAILFGPLTQRYTLPILKKHRFPAHHFRSMDDLVRYLHSHLPPKSWVLFKGSQNNIFLERAIASLLLKKSDQKYLCRRGDFWDRLRQQAP